MSAKINIDVEAHNARTNIGEHKLDNIGTGCNLYTQYGDTNSSTSRERTNRKIGQIQDIGFSRISFDNTSCRQDDKGQYNRKHG